VYEKCATHGVIFELRTFMAHPLLHSDRAYQFAPEFCSLI
jgi:hypothetical protein